MQFCMRKKKIASAEYSFIVFTCHLCSDTNRAVNIYWSLVSVWLQLHLLKLTVIIAKVITSKRSMQFIFYFVLCPHVLWGERKRKSVNSKNKNKKKRKCSQNEENTTADLTEIQGFLLKKEVPKNAHMADTGRF